MGVIQSGINKLLGTAAAFKKVENIQSDIKGLKESTSAIGQEIKLSRPEQKAYEQYVTNPNILKLAQADRERAVNNALMKERAAAFKAQQSLASKAEARAKQMSMFDQLKVSIGGQDIDISKLGKDVQQQIKENIDGK